MEKPVLVELQHATRSDDSGSHFTMLAPVFVESLVATARLQRRDVIVVVQNESVGPYLLEAVVPETRLCLHHVSIMPALVHSVYRFYICLQFAAHGVGLQGVQAVAGPAVGALRGLCADLKEPCLPEGQVKLGGQIFRHVRSLLQCLYYAGSNRGRLPFLHLLTSLNV